MKKEMSNDTEYIRKEDANRFLSKRYIGILIFGGILFFIWFLGAFFVEQKEVVWIFPLMGSIVFFGFAFYLSQKNLSFFK